MTLPDQGNLTTEETERYWADFDADSFAALAAEWATVGALGYDADALKALWAASLLKVEVVVKTGEDLEGSALNYAAVLWTHGYVEGMYTLAFQQQSEAV